MKAPPRTKLQKKIDKTNHKPNKKRNKSKNIEPPFIKLSQLRPLMCKQRTVIIFTTHYNFVTFDQTQIL